MTDAQDNSPQVIAQRMRCKGNALCVGSDPKPCWLTATVWRSCHEGWWGGLWWDSLSRGKGDALKLIAGRRDLNSSRDPPVLMKITPHPCSSCYMLSYINIYSTYISTHTHTVLHSHTQCVCRLSYNSSIHMFLYVCVCVCVTKHCFLSLCPGGGAGIHVVMAAVGQRGYARGQTACDGPNTCLLKPFQLPFKTIGCVEQRVVAWSGWNTTSTLITPLIKSTRRRRIRKKHRGTFVTGLQIPAAGKQSISGPRVPSPPPPPS